MKARHRRFAWIGVGLLALGGAAALVLNAFQSNLVFFFTPSQVIANEAPQARAFRIGGLVEPGSLKRDPNSLMVQFRVTDTAGKTRTLAAQGIPLLHQGGDPRTGQFSYFDARDRLGILVETLEGY